MMRIVFSTDNIKRGGKERQLFILARQLLLQGNEVFIVCFRFSSENYIDEYDFPMENLLNLYEKGFRKSLQEFRKRIRLIKPGILMSWDIRSSLMCLLSYRRMGFLFINASIQHGKRLLNYTHLLRSIIAWCSPYVIANSHAGLRVNNLREGRRRFVLYNGIEARFSELGSRSESEGLRRELFPAFSKHPGVVFISIANFTPFKDYKTVINSLTMIHGKMKFYYIIVGDGPLRKDIEELISEKGISESVVFTGKVENISKYLGISDILIHSSRGEGASNAILEAMCAGLPVIATHVGGTPEIIYPDSSKLFRYRDEEALIRLLNDHEVLFRDFDPAMPSYQKHLEKFSVRTMLNTFLMILEQVQKLES